MYFGKVGNCSEKIQKVTKKTVLHSLQKPDTSDMQYKLDDWFLYRMQHWDDMD